MTPSLILDTVASTLRVSAEDMQSKAKVDDEYRMSGRVSEWTPARMARGMVLHWIKVRCPLAPEYGVGKLLGMEPSRVDGEREAFRERMRRNPELRKAAAKIEDALKEARSKGKVRL